MSPAQAIHRTRWPLFIGGVCIAVGLVAGPLLMAGVLGGSGSDDDGSPAPSHSGTSDDGRAGGDLSSSGPEVVSWGQEGRQVAVVVRNDSDQVVDHARVRITGLDAARRTVVSTTGPDNHVCCTVFGLPPGEEFGIYAPVRPSAAKVTEVSVEYVDADERAVQPKEGRVVADRGRLQRSDDNTVVTARLTARGPVPDYVAAQAFLVRPDGSLAQVISGRYWCYQPGTQRRIRLELFRAVPRNLRLDKVVAHPIPDDVPPGVKGGC